MKRKFKSYLIHTMSALSILAGAMSSSVVSASAISVNPDDPSFEGGKNELVIDPHIQNKVTSLDLIAGSKPTKMEKSWTGDDLLNIHNTKASQKGMAMAYWDDEKKIDPKTTIQFSYDQSGTMKGDNVTAKFTFSNIIGGDMHIPNNQSDHEYAYIQQIDSNATSAAKKATKKLLKQASESKTDDNGKQAKAFNNLLSQGFYIRGIKQFDWMVQFFDKDNKEIGFDSNKGNTFLTFNSMNPVTEDSMDQEIGEFVGYDKMNDNPYYLRKDTIMSEYSGKDSDNKQVVGGNGDASKYKENLDWDLKHDVLGDPDFSKASVSYKIDGKGNKFTVGNTSTGYHQQWIALSSATLWQAKPDKPQKTVTDTEGNDLDGKTVLPGQELDYHVIQKTGVLGQDMLSQYKTFTFTDKLPKDVTFNGKALLGDATKLDNAKAGKFDNEYDVTNSGKLEYDKDTNTVKYTLSADFLKKMALDGRYFVLTVPTTVNNDVKDGADIKNTASTNIDGNTNNTNEVDDHAIKPKIADPTKNVTDEKGNDLNHKEVKVGDKLIYSVNQTTNILGKDILKPYDNFSFKDPIPKQLTFDKKVELVDDKGGKYDTSKAGKLTFDDKTNTVKYELNKDFLNKDMKIDGRTYSLKIYTTVNESAKDGSTFKNVASTNVNSTDRNTNEVDNFSKKPAQPKEKELPQTGHKNSFMDRIISLFLNI